MIKYLPEYKAKIQFWDLAGLKRFDNITNSYIKSADIVIFVYNLQDHTTVDKIKNKHLSYYSHNYSFKGIVVGTHINNKESNLSGEKFAKDNYYLHFKLELKKLWCRKCIKWNNKYFSRKRIVNSTKPTV